MKKAKIFMV